MPDAKQQIAGLLLGLNQAAPQPTGLLSDLGSPVPESQGQWPGLLSDLGSYLSPSNQSWAPWPVRAVRTSLSALAAPHDAYTGELPMTDASGHTSLDAIGRAADLAGLLTLGAGAVPAEADALNAGLTGLRQRYAPYLREASGGKDPARIKLTPERIAAAKEMMQTGFGSFPEGRQIAPLGSLPSPYRVTQQAQQAMQFAAQARQAVDDVRVKFPEGPRGSVYVRVGDNGTVRFADHLPPIEDGQIVGGYSKALGRRHQPATVDASRGKYDESINTAPAYDWLAKILSGDAT